MKKLPLYRIEFHPKTVLEGKANIVAETAQDAITIARQAVEDEGSDFQLVSVNPVIDEYHRNHRDEEIPLRILWAEDEPALMDREIGVEHEGKRYAAGATMPRVEEDRSIGGDDEINEDSPEDTTPKAEPTDADKKGAVEIQAAREGLQKLIAEGKLDKDGTPINLVNPVLSVLFAVVLSLCFQSARAGDDFERDETFTFEPGERRDPFSFTRKLPTVLEPLTPVAVDVDVQKLDPARVAQKKMEALTHYGLAEQALLEDNAIDAIQHCDRGLEVFRDVEISKYRELQDIRDNIMRMRKAAERIRQRADVEREFGMLNIKLTGVVARDRNPEAIINSVVVGRGDVVNETVIVSDIRPQQVIVLYRGFRLALSIQK